MNATLRQFKVRVKVVAKSCEAPNPAQPIQEFEIIDAVMSLIAENESLRKRIEALESRPSRPSLIGPLQ